MALNIQVDTYADFVHVASKYKVDDVYYWIGGSPDLLVRLYAVGHGVSIFGGYWPNPGETQILTDFPQAYEMGSAGFSFTQT